MGFQVSDVVRAFRRAGVHHLDGEEYDLGEEGTDLVMEKLLQGN